jgi:hypothetical protein
MPAATSSALDSAVDTLVAAGILRRAGRQVVADRNLAARVSALTKNGVSIDCMLDVLIAAAEAGRTVSQEIERAMAQLGGRAMRERAHRELLDLTATVLASVVTVDLTTLSIDRTLDPELDVTLP